MEAGQKITNDLGEVNISKDVIAIMAGLTAMECYGLVGMASQTFQDGIAALVGKENLTRGIKIDVIEEGVVLDLYIIVEYGVKISEVANNVIDRVKYTLEENAGVKVKEVNINVQGVRLDNVE